MKLAIRGAILTDFVGLYMAIMLGKHVRFEHHDVDVRGLGSQFVLWDGEEDIFGEIVLCACLVMHSVPCVIH